MEAQLNIYFAVLLTSQESSSPWEEAPRPHTARRWLVQ